MGVFACILLELTPTSQDSETVMIDATHVKAHRIASNLRSQKWVASERSAAG